MRIIHRELSYVFAGMLLIYAISGIALNHKNTFNSQYSVSRTELQIPAAVRGLQAPDDVKRLLHDAGVKAAYIQHYYPDNTTLKVFLKGNSSLVVDVSTGNALLEEVHKRPLLGSLSKLHYNPGRAWTVFSDTFAVAMILVVLTGLLMLKGKHGLWGWGGLEVLIGMLIPLLFLLL